MAQRAKGMKTVIVVVLMTEGESGTTPVNAKVTAWMLERSY